MGTDAQIFALQRSVFPQILVPPWLPPTRGETLPAFAARMAASLDLHGPCIVGGVSFGGFVALEMARHLDARGCILISSLRGPQELPRWAKVGAPLAWLLPPRADRWLSLGGWLMLKTLGPVLPQRLRGVCTHLSKTRAPLLAWAARAVVRWQTDGAWPCPIHQIHGDADPLFPLRCTVPDQIVPRGGHLLTLTHPFVVNAFLERVLLQIHSGDARSGSEPE